MSRSHPTADEKNSVGHEDYDHSQREPLQQDNVKVLGEKGKKSYQPSLVKALAKAFWDTFLMSAFFKLMQDILLFVNPQLLQ